MPLNYFQNLPTPSRPRVDPMALAGAFAARPIPTPPEYGTILDVLGRSRAQGQQAQLEGVRLRANAGMRQRELDYDWEKFMAQLNAAKEQAERTGDTQTLNNLITLGTLVGTRAAGQVPWAKLWNAIRGGGVEERTPPMPETDPGFPYGTAPGADTGGNQGFYDYPTTPGMNLTDYDYGLWDPAY